MSLELKIQDHVAVITFNRPDAMNSIDVATREELYRIWDRLKLSLIHI